MQQDKNSERAKHLVNFGIPWIGFGLTLHLFAIHDVSSLSRFKRYPRTLAQDSLVTGEQLHSQVFRQRDVLTVIGAASSPACHRQYPLRRNFIRSPFHQRQRVFE